MGRRAGLLIAIIGGRPIGELEPGEENEKDRERAPFQETFDLHRPNKSDRFGWEGFHIGASDQEIEHDRELTEQDRLQIEKRLVVVIGKEKPDHAEKDVAETVDH